MITRVRIKNFRSIADADVELGPLTVLVGRNGAGKSAFVDVLRFVRDTLQIGLENTFTKRYGFDSVAHQSPTNSKKSIEIELTFRGQVHPLEGQYGFRLTNDSDEGYSITREFCNVRSNLTNQNDSFDWQNGSWIIKPSNEASTVVRDQRRNSDPYGLLLPIISRLSPLYSGVAQLLTGDYYYIFSKSLLRTLKQA